MSPDRTQIWRVDIPPKGHHLRLEMSHQLGETIHGRAADRQAFCCGMDFTAFSSTDTLGSRMGQSPEQSMFSKSFIQGLYKFRIAMQDYERIMPLPFHLFLVLACDHGTQTGVVVGLAFSGIL